jgi:TM2 domain-containing membrane protein YozV
MAQCVTCGAGLKPGESRCVKCGTSVEVQPSAPQAIQTPQQPQIVFVQPPPQYSSQPPVAVQTVSPKSKVTAALLCFFLGWLGVHRFYAGQIGTAVTMLLLFIVGVSTVVIFIGAFLLWGLGLWIFIDFIIILTGNFKDKTGLYLKN